MIKPQDMSNRQLTKAGIVSASIGLILIITFVIIDQYTTTEYQVTYHGNHGTIIIDGPGYTTKDGVDHEYKTIAVDTSGNLTNVTVNYEEGGISGLFILPGIAGTCLFLVAFIYRDNRSTPFDNDLPAILNSYRKIVSDKAYNMTMDNLKKYNLDIPEIKKKIEEIKEWEKR